MRLPSNLGCATLFDLGHENCFAGAVGGAAVDRVVIKGPGGHALLPP